MKTFYKLLGWIFGISAFSAMVSGIIIPISSGGLSNEEGLFRLLIIFFPLLLASFFTHNKAKEFEWENDFPYLVSKLVVRKIKILFALVNKKADETKDKIKDDLKKN